MAGGSAGGVTTRQQIICQAPAMAAGRYHIKVVVPGFGFAAHGLTDNAANLHGFESLLRVDSVAPRVGSLAGGMTVTLSGSGFSTEPRNNTVQVQAANRTKLAHVLGSTASQLVVVMPTFEREGILQGPTLEPGIANGRFERIGPATNAPGSGQGYFSGIPHGWSADGEKQNSRFGEKVPSTCPHPLAHVDRVHFFFHFSGPTLPTVAVAYGLSSYSRTTLLPRVPHQVAILDQ